jgi:cytochrome P450
MADGGMIMARDARERAERLAAAREAAESAPLESLNPIQQDFWLNDTAWPTFARMRRESPVHYTAESEFGPYWSVTKYDDVVAIDSNHQDFSSAKGITVVDGSDDFPLPMFIAMDPPKHDAQRKTIAPSVAPPNLAEMAPIIRERAAGILDELPIGEEFDWVDRVSVELTTMTLATLFDFPWEDRRKLTRWSDLITGGPNATGVETQEEWRAEMMGCLAYFSELRAQRVNGPPKNDLITMLARGEATKDMPQMEYLGNILLLIVGGNDTTRNTISGSILALNRFPDEFRKLHADHSLLPAMVSETVRWQTPVNYMRRTANRDYELHGKTIREGDKVLMWYASGNKDEEKIERPEDFWVGRPNHRQHQAFGFGIHRCVGNRLAELQLQIIWDEILKRFPEIVQVGPPKRLGSAFIRGIERLPVVIPKRH